MSIVETALGKAKLQQRPGEEPRAAAERPVAERPEPTRPTLVKDVAPPSAPTPRSTVQLDFDAILAEGMMPPRDLAQRYADEFRRVKWPILDVASGKVDVKVPDPNLLLVTSSVPSEGKSFVSLNLSLNVASGTTRVLLIDADPAKARISRLCGVHGRPGFLDVLADDSLSIADVVIGTNVPGLDIIPAGKSHALSAELFSSARADALLAELARQDPQRLVLLDSAPLLATNEAQVLSRRVGQVLMVVKCNDTPASAVKAAVELIDTRPLARCLLNQVRTGLFADGYASYYGYYAAS